MDKAEIIVAGFPIIQLTETEFEAENKTQRLDFYFDVGHPSAVEVLIFDSDTPTQGDQDPYLTRFYAANLEEAVIKAMDLRRETLSKVNLSMGNSIVQELRSVASFLSSLPNSATERVLFPGWDKEYEEGNEELIKVAASAILAEGVEPDEGTSVSLEAVAALLHYVADMLE